MGVIFLLIFAPFAFGSVHVWAYSLIEFGVFFFLAIWFVDKLIFSRTDTLEWVKTPVNLFLILILLIIGLQMAPLPSSWIAFLSPRTFVDKMQIFEVAANVKDSGLDGSRWTCLAYYLHSAIVEWLKLAAYMGMFFLVLNTAGSEKRINILIGVLVFVGIFEAVYAIFQVFSITPGEWWWKSLNGGGRFAGGTFIRSNHFAAYMGMLVPLTFGFMIAMKKRGLDVRGRISGFGGQSGGHGSIVQRAVSWFSPESVQPKIIFLFFAGTIMALSLLLSGSRGGILSFAGSMFLMSVLFFTKKRFRKYGVAAMVFCLIFFIWGLNVGIDKTFDQFKQTKGMDSHLMTTRSIMPMLRDYPVMGVGWGNFRYLYPRYIQNYDDRVSGCGRAHNDWIKAGAEIGIAGGFLIFIAFAVYLIKMVRIWKKRKNYYALGIGCGAMAGLLSAGFNSYFEFNMHIPANPLTLAALLGIGYAALHRQGRGYSESFFYKVRKISLTRTVRIVMFCMVFFAFAASVFTTGRHLFAETKYAAEWNSAMNLNRKPYLAEIQEAIDHNPGNAEYHFKLAEYYMSTEIKDRVSGVGERRSEYNELAIASLKEAVRLNPANGIYWYNSGKCYSFKSYDPYRYVNKWLPLAEECFDVGIYCAPNDSDMLFDVAWYWVWRASMLKEEGLRFKVQGSRLKDAGEEGNGTDVAGRRSELEDGGMTFLVGRDGWISGRLSLEGMKINVDESLKLEVGSGREGKGAILFREDGIRKFQRLFQRSLDLDPKHWKKAVDRVWKYYPDDAVVIGIVPENNEELKSLVMRFLAKKG